MQEVNELTVGEERLLQFSAKCIICSHTWQLVMAVTIIEVDGTVVPDVSDVPDKVECPSCGGMYGEPEV